MWIINNIHFHWWFNPIKSYFYTNIFLTRQNTKISHVMVVVPMKELFLGILNTLHQCIYYRSIFKAIDDALGKWKDNHICIFPPFPQIIHQLQKWRKWSEWHTFGHGSCTTVDHAVPPILELIYTNTFFHTKRIMLKFK